MKRPVISGLTAAVLLVAIAFAMAPFASAEEAGQTVRITAQKFFYTPKDITLKKGVPAVLEFTSKDVMHGFSCPDLGIRSDILPGQVATVKFIPAKAGTFPFHCDIFCGSGHETMGGTITVTE